jgi:hypothetical protein
MSRELTSGQLSRVVRRRPRFYLLYLDAAGDEMTDTWHQTFDDALHHAEFEFSVKPSEWRRVTERA